MTNALLSSENINFAYAGSAPILKDFSFTLSKGEFSGLIGPNGAGKTTVFRVLSGFIPVKTGAVKLKGKNISSYKNTERAKLLAVVPQDIFTPMPYTTRQIVEMGRVSRISRLSVPSKSDREHVNRSMEAMDIAHKAESLFNHLSGGEKQRALIATAIAQEPEVLLLDEPTSSLDIGHSCHLMKLLLELNREKQITVLIISHDIQLAGSFCSRLILMKDGGILSDGNPQEILTKETIKEAYGCDVELIKNRNGRFLISPE